MPIRQRFERRLGLKVMYWFAPALLALSIVLVPLVWLWSFNVIAFGFGCFSPVAFVRQEQRRLYHQIGSGANAERSPF